MRTALLLAATALLACGSDSYDDDGGTPPGEPGEASGFRIVISGNRFAPLRLEVSPGATVSVRNMDSMPHSVTSQSAPGTFRPGAVAGISFDTGAFVGERSIVIPATAAVGTEIPYYCSTHLGTMTTPNGTIVVAAAPSNPAMPGQTGGDGDPY